MKELLKKEIKISENAIKELGITRDKCIKGIELQKLVLNAIKEELKCISTS